ncbi:MAG: AAA family ATPase, partial [Streptosporangiaceae bacterium]
RYTSQAVLDAEQRLLSAARTPVSCGLAGPAVAAAVDGYEGLTGGSLDPGQRQLVTAFAARGTLLSAGLGPAGSGKTTAMRALAFVLRQSGLRLIPLATSAAAAGVLGRELGVHADNLHKFLYEHTRGKNATRLRDGGRLPAAARPYALRRGDVVLVDEAGMAGTFALDQLAQIAAHHGAVVRLLGDDRQLSAVESGGALRLIAQEAGAVELTALYRFSDPAEAAATLKLRTGDASGLDYYLTRDRVRSGSRAAMTEAAYAGWRADMLAGKTTLMTAASGTDVTALSAQARAERAAAGQVEADGVPLRDGTLAGRGDWIVTRQNNRRFAVHGGRDWVKNGDAWRVLNRHRDGALQVEHLTHRGRVTLPADYVTGHVQLLYATTAHRAQGTTVDTAHALITPEMNRESFYVTASRARQATIFYTATHNLLPLDEDARLDAARTDPRSYAAREVLENVLAREGAELSATETIRMAQDQAGSLATLVPRYHHAAQILADVRYRQTAIDVLGADNGHRLASDPAWSAVVRALHDAEAIGWRPGQLLTEVTGLRELRSARSIAEVIAWRIDAHITDRPAPPRLDQPTEAEARRYAGLLRALPGFAEAALDPAVAVQPPSLWPPRAGEKRNPAQRAIETVAATGVVTRVLGAKLASRARSEPAWPALAAALSRAQRCGHDPAALLGQLARSRELRTARSLSEVLAWRIGEHLIAGHSTAGSAETGVQTMNPQTWARLAWTIKAAENSGCDATEAVETASHEPDPVGALLALTRTIATRRSAPSLPPWIKEPAASSAKRPVTDNQIAGYLSTVAGEIRKRVHALTADATDTRPAWVNALGAVPSDHARHQEWLHHLGVVAAYRDQYQITSD